MGTGEKTWEKKPRIQWDVNIRDQEKASDKSYEKYNAPGHELPCREDRAYGGSAEVPQSEGLQGRAFQGPEHGPQLGRGL